MESLIEGIQSAIQSRARLRIRGGDSKKDLRPLYALAGDQESTAPSTDLDTRSHQGISNYQASELVITVKAGTPLAEVEAALAEKNQMLPFEPPHFSSGGGMSTGTIGGAIASAFAGPRALLITGVRDFVLGVRVLDGQARALRFGGEVMKNVAGFDVSRLLCGSRGRLGVLTEVSLKVLPQPVQQRTITLHLDAPAAHRYTHTCLRQGRPISGASWYDGVLALRLSATPLVLEDALAKMQSSSPCRATELEDAATFWRELNNHQAPFFSAATELWRVRVERGEAERALPHEEAFSVWHEVGGEVRWLRPKADLDQAQAQHYLAALRQVARVQIWRTRLALAPRNTPLAPARQVIEERIRAVFDPHHLFV